MFEPNRLRRNCSLWRGKRHNLAFDDFVSELAPVHDWTSLARVFTGSGDYSAICVAENASREPLRCASQVHQTPLARVPRVTHRLHRFLQQPTECRSTDSFESCVIFGQPRESSLLALYLPNVDSALDMGWGSAVCLLVIAGAVAACWRCAL